jgi:hypothetical protein
VLATHVRLTEYAGAATPVPVRVAAPGEFVALLVNDALVDASPLD